MDEYVVKEPYTIIDEATAWYIYVGTTLTTNRTSQPVWKIVKFMLAGNVWQKCYPNGSQNFDFVWDERGSYNYS